MIYPQITLIGSFQKASALLGLLLIFGCGYTKLATDDEKRSRASEPASETASTTVQPSDSSLVSMPSDSVKSEPVDRPVTGPKETGSVATDRSTIDSLATAHARMRGPVNTDSLRAAVFSTADTSVVIAWDCLPYLKNGRIALPGGR